MVFNDTRVDGSCQCVFFSGVKRGWRDLTTVTSIGPFEVELQWPNVSQQQEWPRPKKSPTEIKKSRRKTVKRTGRLREWSMVPKHSMHKWSNHGKESWKKLAFSWSASVIYISYYLKLVAVYVPESGKGLKFVALEHHCFLQLHQNKPSVPRTIIIGSGMKAKELLLLRQRCWESQYWEQN